METGTFAKNCIPDIRLYNMHNGVIWCHHKTAIGLDDIAHGRVPAECSS